MRTQGENPLYSKYGQRLAPGGRYPAEHVNLFWNEDAAGGRVRDLEVVFVPRGGIVPVTGDGYALWEAFGSYIARWTNDMGNACNGWMEPNGLTPAQIFGHLLRITFADQDELIAALREIASIEGQTWAHDMLSAFVDEEEVH